MSRLFLLGLFLIVCLLAAFFVYRHPSQETLPTKDLVAIPQASPPCPWRDAERDMTNWFPGATGYSSTDHILSGQRLELQKRLGRPLLPDESALHVYLVASNTTPLGSVLTRRFKGSGGAMEVALALDPDNMISAFKIQRMREPAEIVESLNSLKLEEQLRGKCVIHDLSTINITNASPLAASLASNIIAAVQSLLVLNDAGGTDPHAHHH